METGETGETLFFISCFMRELDCEKKRQILEISEKCYFSIHFPILELEERILLQQPATTDLAANLRILGPGHAAIYLGGVTSEAQRRPLARAVASAWIR